MVAIATIVFLAASFDVTAIVFWAASFGMNAIDAGNAVTQLPCHPVGLIPLAM